MLADVHAAPHSKNAIPAVEAAASESHTRLAPDVDGAAPGQPVAVIWNDIAMVFPSITHFRTGVHFPFRNTLLDGQVTSHFLPSICFSKTAFMSVGEPEQVLSCVARYRTRKVTIMTYMEWMNPTDDYMPPKSRSTLVLSCAF